MPVRSIQQNRLMQAAAHTPGGVAGVPQSVGKDFVAAGPAGGSFAKLPKKVKPKTGARTSKALGEGRVSQAAMDRAMARRA